MGFLQFLWKKGHQTCAKSKNNQKISIKPVKQLFFMDKPFDDTIKIMKIPFWFNRSSFNWESFDFIAAFFQSKQNKYFFSRFLADISM